MANKEHYYPFIEEVFINPVRSVLIIDDDYPTFDEVLRDDNGQKKDWHSTPDRNRIYKVIRKFRERSHPLLVDVSDGTNIPADPGKISHLHQSDLLVLDYELDKTSPEDGTTAINILRGLMSNRHFNLVVVYTQVELDKVFDEVRWSLIDESDDSLSPEKLKEAEKLIEESEDKLEGFEQQLRESLPAEGYFYSRLNSKKYLRDMAKGRQPYSAFYDQIKELDWNSDQKKLVLRYLLKEIERKNRSSEDKSFSLSWSRPTGPVKWIRSDSAFVAFSQKSDDDDLIKKLQSALNNWCPNPSRLFLTKIQAEINESGFVAQEQALNNDHAAAYWYERLLQADDEAERHWLAAENIARHSDQLMDIVLGNVEGFVNKLIEAEIERIEEKGENIGNLCKERFDIDLGNADTRIRAALEHNEFVCNKKPEGWHLTTGHVFSMCNGEYWVCLSPACDMVPSQISDWNKQTSGDNLPFIGVKLLFSKDSITLKHIRSNRIVVLKVNGEIKGFSFNDLSEEGSTPFWNLLYAENQGKFANDFRFKVLRTEKNGENLIFNSYEAEVVSQLRYEYALNLIQKLGVSLTRVGLDFSDGKSKS
ncbi:MAG: response regulator receiver domain [Candidatus Dadabacteria bacterium]|nr:response regulator receiver domain [Candidatus Dadabacteria bacterium]MDE0477862.1 response regulator receiver domain [Candidatus Dadabacteria bacterium]